MPWEAILASANSATKAGKKMKKLLLILSATLLLSAENLTNDIGMKFAKIPSGSFMMGRDASLEVGGKDELPRHRVDIGAFEMQTTEVTQDQWVRVMGSNPSKFKGMNNPVDQVSWNDVQKFIQKLNKLEGTSVYRLPTEAEWEYAARAGGQSTYFFGDDNSTLGSYAWFKKNSGNQTHPVGTKQSNSWGLYDMNGNVYEWCQDWYIISYQSTPTDGSANTDGKQKDRVLRGVSWNNVAYVARIAFRSFVYPERISDEIGFRLVRTLP